MVAPKAARAGKGPYSWNSHFKKRCEKPGAEPWKSKVLFFMLPFRISFKIRFVVLVGFFFFLTPVIAMSQLLQSLTKVFNY